MSKRSSVILILLAPIAIGVGLTILLKPEADEQSPPPVDAPIRTHWGGGENDRNPQISFPKSTRCENDQVNQFVSDLLDIIYKQDYREYRRHVTQRRDPIGSEKFEAMYLSVRTIDINAVETIDDTSKIALPHLKEIEPPVYRIRAHVVLNSTLEKDVELFVFKENGEWVTSH